MKSVLKTILISLRTIKKAEFKRILFYIFNTILGIVQSFVFGVLFFKFFLEALFEKQNFYVAAIMLCVQAVWQIIYAAYKEWYANIYIESSNARIQEAVYSGLFEKTVTMDMHTLESPEYHDTFRMVLQNSVGAMLSVADNIFSYVENIILLVLNGCLLFTYEPLLFPFIILSVICSYFSDVLNNKYRVAKNRALNPLVRRYEYVKRLFYSTEHAYDIKSTDIYDVLINSADTTNDNIEKVQKKFNNKLFTVASLSNVISILLRQIPNIWICAKAILERTITSGDIAVTIRSMANVRNTLNSFLSLYPKIQENCIYVMDYSQYIESEAKIKANEGGAEPQRTANGISLKHISFSYDGEKEVLKDITINIRGGEKIAIVGKNGVGKSTLVKLLLQLYRPQSGEIEMDGKPAEMYSLKAYRDRFGVAFQNTQLYAVSVAENVLMKPYDEEETEKERIIGALKNGRLYDRVAEEEKGIETVVTKEFDGDGIEFSGGQAQKLALSRVYARDCGVVILDEPSAALDPISEAEMYESIIDLMKEKTVILISHRLSACRKVDRIYVIEDGKIAEQGSHTELLHKDGIYAAMWHLQASGYLEA